MGNKDGSSYYTIVLEVPDSIKKRKKHTDCKSRNKAVFVCGWNDCLCKSIWNNWPKKKKNPGTKRNKNNPSNFAGYQAKIQNAVFTIN